jgi:hypothetical protein
MAKPVITTKGAPGPVRTDKSFMPGRPPTADRLPNAKEGKVKVAKPA